MTNIVCYVVLIFVIHLHSVRLRGLFNPAPPRSGKTMMAWCVCEVFLMFSSIVQVSTGLHGPQEVAAMAQLGGSYTPLLWTRTTIFLRLRE